MSAQALANIRKATERRRRSYAARDALIGAPPAQVLAALRNPDEDLARLPLRYLFAAGSAEYPGPIPAFGASRLRRALTRAAKPYGRLLHDRMHLGELTPGERDRLIGALIAVAPSWWTASKPTPERSTR